LTEIKQKFVIDFEKDLNKEQLEVVTKAEGPCLVLAGAGSGKTRTITYRVAYLLEKGVSPENILLVTFTNKAARVMIERVATLAAGVETQNFASLPRATLPWSGTFHHIAYRVLKKYATFLGYKNNFSVLDRDDSSNLIKQCLKEEGIDRTMKRFPSPAVLQSIISYARNAETIIEDVLNLKYEHFLPIADSIKHLASNYEKRKKAANVMDFDDLLLNWLLLLQQSEKIRERHQDQFHHVLVDEYQDTNKIQASIIRIIAQKHRNLLVVGDDAQSIYSFRAADIKNILDFEKEYSNAKIFKLETNYRSTPDILNLANDVISNNVKQYKKELRSILQSFAKPEAKSFDESTGEAIYVADKIEELIDEGSSPEKIAVLFRAARHSQALEMELMKRGIVYDYRGGIRFFERSHVKDVLAYLRILNNQTDEMAWRRVLGMQVGIGDATIELILRQVARPLPIPLLCGGEGNIDLPARAGIGWNDFLQIYNKLKDAGEVSVGDLIHVVIESKYIEYLENEYPDYRERMQDLEQMAVFADKAESLDAFLAESSLQENFRSIVETQNFASLRGDGKIVLSTIHQAKGLEWDAVFIINLSNGQFPNERALRENDGLDEERRLFYVAITRAKKYLHLTYSSASLFGGFQGGPSMFLEEIDRELVNMEENGTVFNDGENEVVYIPDEQLKRKSGFLKNIEDL